MSKIMITVIAAIALAQPVSSTSNVPGGESRSDCLVKQGSFVPHTNTHNHVYGSPIGQPILGRSKATHRPRTSQKTFKTF